jgi:hypothetical protein
MQQAATQQQHRVRIKCIAGSRHYTIAAAKVLN